jgi:hypothetical protein
MKIEESKRFGRISFNIIVTLSSYDQKEQYRINIQCVVENVLVIETRGIQGEVEEHICRSQNELVVYFKSNRHEAPALAQSHIEKSEYWDTWERNPGALPGLYNLVTAMIGRLREENKGEEQSRMTSV